MSGRALQRPTWGGVPVRGGDFFTLRKRKGETEHVAVCEVWSHLFGWELRLLINGESPAFGGLSAQTQWLGMAEDWQSGMLEKRWAVCVQE